MNGVASPTSGHLRLTFIEAKLTHDTDIGKMDPFCKIYLREDFYQTDVKHKAGKHPVWN